MGQDIKMDTKLVYMAGFDFGEFISGLFSGGLAAEAMRYVRDKTKLKIDLSEAAKDISEIHSLLQEMSNETRFNRNMVFVGEDSGGVLVPGKRLYVTAQYEALNDTIHDVKPIKHEIQRWEADNYYYEWYSQMIVKGKLNLVVKDMPKEAKLTAIYQGQKVKCSNWFHLLTSEDLSRVYYMSSASTIVEDASAIDRYKVEAKVDRIKFIMNKYKKFYNQKVKL